jgi:hypothetical protein
VKRGEEKDEGKKRRNEMEGFGYCATGWNRGEERKKEKEEKKRGRDHADEGERGPDP